MFIGRSAREESSGVGSCVGSDEYVGEDGVGEY